MEGGESLAKVNPRASGWRAVHLLPCFPVDSISARCMEGVRGRHCWKH